MRWKGIVSTVVRQVSDAVCPWWGSMVSKGENNTSEGTLLEVRLRNSQIAYALFRAAETHPVGIKKGCRLELSWSTLYDIWTYFPLMILCCLKLLDKLHMDDRHPEKPLRVPVLDRYNDRGTMVLGKVEQVSIKTVWRIMCVFTLMPEYDFTAALK